MKKPGAPRNWEALFGETAEERRASPLALPIRSWMPRVSTPTSRATPVLCRGLSTGAPAFVAFSGFDEAFEATVGVLEGDGYSAADGVVGATRDEAMAHVSGAWDAA